MTTEANIIIEDSSNGNQVIKIAHVSGQLDESNIDEKIQEIYKIVEANPKGLHLIYDLEKLEYMNSKSIGYITDLYSKITESGGQVALVRAKANILDILQVVGLTQLIKYFETIDEAKKSFGTPALTNSPQANVVPAVPTATVQATPAPATTVIETTPAPSDNPGPTAAPATAQPQAATTPNPTLVTSATVSAPTPAPAPAATNQQ